MIEPIPFMLLTLALGFKHSYDADHLIAVSVILRKVNSVINAIKIGLSWAVGHMLTAGIITLLLFAFKESFLQNVLPYFEKIVGIILIILGLWGLKDVFFAHSHKHRHGNIVHSHLHIHDKNKNHSGHYHKHMLGIGVIHGLASNDEILILLTASLGVATLGGIMLGIGMFSIGVVAGMVLFSVLLSIPVIKANSAGFYRIVSAATGLISIVYGASSLFAII